MNKKESLPEEKEKKRFWDKITSTAGKIGWAVAAIGISLVILSAL